MKQVKILVMFVFLFVSFSTFAKVTPKSGMHNKKMIQGPAKVMDVEWDEDAQRIEDEAYLEVDAGYAGAQEMAYQDEYQEGFQGEEYRQNPRKLAEEMTEEEMALANSIPQEMDRQDIEF